MNQVSGTNVIAGSGRVQWHPGAWFGLTMGASSWLVYGTFHLVSAGFSYKAKICGVSWLVSVGLACWLWIRRDRLAPFGAIVRWLLALALLMPVVWFSCFDQLVILNVQRVPSIYWVRIVAAVGACALYPVILFCFSMCERSEFPQDDANSKR